MVIMGFMENNFKKRSAPLNEFLLFLGLLIFCSCSLQTRAIVTGKPGEINSNQSVPSSNINTELTQMDLDQAQKVTYCELIQNPVKYDRRIVRLRAIYFTGFEKQYLYDERCQEEQPPVAPEKVPAQMWTQFDKSFVLKGDSDEAVLNRQLNTFGRKDITVTGRFYSTNEQGDSNAPNLFGHLNCCRFQFLITRLEKINLSSDDEEGGKPTIVSGPVDFIKESDEKVSVGLTPYAQMYYLYREDANFEEQLNLLKNALKTKHPVQCTFRQFSGRILKVVEKP